MNQQTITPERQIAAAQVGAAFSSLHQYLNTLALQNDEGQLLMTEQLRNAHNRIEEAGFWAVKHVLSYGVPAAPPAAAESVPDASPVDVEQATPAPLGVVDPPQTLPTDNAAGTESI